MHVFVRPAQRFLSCHACEGLVFAQPGDLPHDPHGDQPPSSPPVPPDPA